MRTPSMDRNEAFAACQTAYQGVSVTTDNRHFIRRFLTADGMPSEYARGLGLADLNAIWFDESGSILASHKAKAMGGATPIAQTIKTIDVTLETKETTMPVTEMPRLGNIDAAAQIAAGLQMLMGKPQLDEDGIRAIVSNELTASTNMLMDMVAEAVASMKPQRAEMVLIVDGAERGTLPATRHPKADLLCKVVHRKVPAFIVGPAGSGKTTAAEQVAQALGMKFYTQGAATGTHEFLGFVDAHGVYQATPFRQAFEHGGLFLADEVDSSDPAVLLVINSALANGVMSFPDTVEPVRKHADFRFVGAANTYGTGADREYVGRNQLDAATIDRFAFIQWDYDADMEMSLCANTDWVNTVQGVRKAVGDLRIRHVVSPRASFFGAELLAEGIDPETVMQMVVWKGMNSADISKVKAHIKSH